VKALLLLLRLKWRGTWRRQLRRLRTPKGAILTVLGIGLFGLWFASIAWSFLSGGAREPEPARLEPRVAAAALVLFLLSLTSALSHRGLYLPRDEIERLFSAPVTRGELVRYRLFASSLRSALGSVVVALAAMRRMPSPPLAFAGIVLGMQTLPIFHQLVAIVLGGLEKRLAEVLRRLGKALFLTVFLAVGLLLYLMFAHRNPEELPLLGPPLEALSGRSGDPLDHELLRAIETPLVPWVRMITADSLAAFLPWFGACLALWLLLLETCARLPLDFRELSLETSASIAARIRRARRGGGAAAGRISTRAAGWRVPWFFGRSPAGAIAWRKTASIVRKAKGTFWVSSLVLVFITALSTFVTGSDAARDETLEGLVTGAAPLLLIAFFGTLYLCAGLRFDFRDELERMIVIRAWPVPAARIFAAMLAPEAALVSALLVGAVCLRAVLAEELHPLLPAIVLLQPLVVFAWIALDNAVFLVAPSRIVPGQEGALQNAGRGLILVLARFFLFVVIFVLGAAAAGLSWWLAHDLFGWQRTPAIAAAFFALWAAIAAVDLGLVLAGGEVLRRFDVARDRG
jgi:hypothetical protein